MKLNVKSMLTNKTVLMVVSVVAVLNVLGYMVIGRFNCVVIFILLAGLTRYFSKNMILVLGIPLIFVNLFAVSLRTFEGFEDGDKKDGDGEKHLDTINKINDKQKQKDQAIITPVPEDTLESSNVKTDEHFEVGRAKNGGSKIDYAATVESAYDELNKVLGSDGIKSLTDDTQRLLKQQSELAKSMEGLAPIVEKMMPMAEKMQGMMNNMNTGGSGGMKSIMDMAQKMTQGINPK